MKKKADVLLALEKIARKTGEDEDKTICDLEEQFKIKITEEEAPLLRKVIRSEHIWIWIKKPYNKKDFEIEKEELSSIKFQRYSSIDKIVIKEKINGKNFIKYPKYILLSDVDDNIFERFLEDYGIKNKDLSLSNWETIICSKEFRQAQIQVARELIADKIHHKLLYKN